MWLRSKPVGIVALVDAVIMFFLPLAVAAGDDTATQTLTLASLGLATLAQGAWWIASRGARRPAWTFGAASLAGVVIAFALLTAQTHTSGGGAAPGRIYLFAAAFALASWMLVAGARIVFPEPVRGYAIGGIALLAFGLFPAPLLLLQQSADLLNVRDAGHQIIAGSLFWTVGMALMVAPFLALTTVPGDWFERWWESAAARVMAVPDRTFSAIVVGIAFVLCAALSIYSFDRRPTTADEIAQLWHAHMLLSGHLAMPPDPNPEFFAIDNVIARPLWMSQFPVGGPAVLAVGLLFRVSWLVNPLLTALTVLNVLRFARRAFGEAQARAAALVIVASPMILLMGGTYMNHTPTVWLVTLALAALPRWMDTTDPIAIRRAAALIGASIGVATAIRPLDGAIAGVVIGLMMLATASRDRLRARSLLAAIAAGAVPVALMLAANWRTTGSPLRFGYEVLWGPDHSLGLHDDPTGHPHTAWRALLLGVKYAVQLNWVSTMWPVPVMLVVACGVFASVARSRWDVLLMSFFAAQTAAYAFYWHDGQFIGPRFVFTAVPALLVLAARAPFLAAARLSGAARRSAIVILPVCICVTWLRDMPPFGVQSLAREFHESRSRLKLDPPQQFRNGTLHNALIFVQEGAAARLLHRLWGAGVSRPDAARLLATADACSLLDALRIEETSPLADSSARLARISALTRPYRASPASPRLPDRAFRVSDTTTMSPACRREVRRDFMIRNAVAYGPMLLLNEFDDAGHVAGPAVFVMDLGEHNERLRTRFGNRTWFRYELPLARPDSTPVLVPYQPR